MTLLDSALRAVTEAADPARIAPLGAVAATVIGVLAMPLIEAVAGRPDETGRTAS